MDQERKTESGRKERNAVVLFPGIGYHCDKPLLYYTAKLASFLGYEVFRVPYGNFPPKVKGDSGKMKDSFELALEQSVQLLADVDWSRYGTIVFAGKSIGTIVSLAYAARKELSVKSLLFTPLAQTFSIDIPEARVFHGTADPWADTPEIIRLCEERSVPLYLADGANHSLETGEVSTDLKTLTEVMRITEDFLKGLV